MFAADLNDVSRDGRALVTLFDQEEWSRGLLPGQKAESRLVSRTDLRMVDLSDDGKLLVLRDAFVAPVMAERLSPKPPARETTVQVGCLDPLSHASTVTSKDYVRKQASWASPGLMPRSRYSSKGLRRSTAR